MVYGHDRRIRRRVKEVDNGDFGWKFYTGAAVLLALAASGIVLCRKYLCGNKTAYILCILFCSLLALACIVYIGLTLLFVGAVQSQPPA